MEAICPQTIDNNEIQVLFMFVTFHTFLIAVVRPFSFTFSKNLLEVFHKSTPLPEGEDYKTVEKYRYWEGGVMHFACNFWIFAILIASAYTLQSFSPFPFFRFDNMLYVLILSYLVVTIIVIWWQWEYFDKDKDKNWLFLIAVIVLFYVTPSLVYSFRNCLRFIRNTNLSVIYCIWLLSALYLLSWHLLAAKWPPLWRLKNFLHQGASQAK